MHSLKSSCVSDLVRDLDCEWDRDLDREWERSPLVFFQNHFNYGIYIII